MPMRQALRLLGIVVLVLLIVLLGLPLGMAMGNCPDCALGAHSLVGACLALLAMLLVLAFPAGSSIIAGRSTRARAVAVAVFERPPRSC